MGLDIQVFLTGQEAIDYITGNTDVDKVEEPKPKAEKKKRKPKVVKIKNEEMSARISEFHQHLEGGTEAVAKIEALFKDKLGMEPSEIREPNQEQMVGMMKLIAEEMADG